ncbi:branched-chain amino acid ABC transporter permease [Hyphomicrobium sp. CS1BSMeth3]|uniref:branched-chain amino acid ABC transporter permease n=1 Tax=Hyphomicrobium sp. CS1BSMeth3 TaxID=1892844 RepID=UPI000930F38E|nr:branched-chain amino acid ABC transporter permease [Hyphomicrobium sp. CS1BSMeth3]
MAAVDLAQNTLDGLMIGSSYALLAIGFTLIFGVMRRLNLAYGPTIMAGVYLGTAAFISFGAPSLVVLAIVIIGASLVGLYVERLCFRPFGEAARTASMVASFALWMQIEEAAMHMLPQHMNPFPPLLAASPLEIGPLMLRADHLIMLAATLLLAGAVTYLLARTKLGLAIRAVIDQPRAAAIVGIHVERIMMLTFVLASAIGGFAGFLIAATDAQVTAMMGMWATTKGLVAMMLGGLGSVKGAIAGGLLLGVLEAHAQWFLGPQVRDMVAWGLLFVILAFWPGGLMGAKALDRTMAVGRRV